MRLRATLCVCVCARGGFSESIGCDGGGCIVSLSCCAAEAGSRSEITGRLAAGVYESCLFYLRLLIDGDIISSSPYLLQLAFCSLESTILTRIHLYFLTSWLLRGDTKKTCAQRCIASLKTWAPDVKIKPMCCSHREVFVL